MGRQHQFDIGIRDDQVQFILWYRKWINSRLDENDEEEERGLYVVGDAFFGLCHAQDIIHRVPLHFVAHVFFKQSCRENEIRMRKRGTEVVYSVLEDSVYKCKRQ